MVAIKNFEKPNACYQCELLDEHGVCSITGDDIFADCPLVEIEERKVGKCTDCNEYNHEKHYCPKFCDVIRSTTEEMQEFYKGEHEKLERIEQIVNEKHYSVKSLEYEIKEVLDKE